LLDRGQKLALMRVIPRSLLKDSYFVGMLSGVDYVQAWLRREGLLSADLVGESLRAYYDFVEMVRTVRQESTRYNVGGMPRVNELLLYSLVRTIRPSLILETGVASGISSFFILKALSENRHGTLTSIDLPNLSNPSGFKDSEGKIDQVYTPPDKGVGWLVPESLRARWSLRLGTSKSVLSNCSYFPEIFYHDSEHTFEVMNFEFEWARSARVPVILADDVQRNPAWLRFTKVHSLPHIETMGAGISVARALRASGN
jgi:hypothetical protein